MTSSAPPDLANAWRDALRDWETHTNAALNRLSGTEQFSQGMNQVLAAVLRAQSAYGEAVEQALIRMNLPNRADIRDLSAKLDDIERRLDMLLAQGGPAGVSVAEAAPSAPPAPPRTRRAPRTDGEGGAA